MAGQGMKAGGGGIEMDEEAAPREMPQGQMMMPPALGISALTITGEFVFFLGVIFGLLGISAFITDALKIKGSGEFLVGLALAMVGMGLLMRSREQMKAVIDQQRKAQMVVEKEMAKQRKDDRPLDGYR